MPRVDASAWKPALRWAAVVAAAASLVVAGMLLGWRLAGAALTETAIGRVSFEVHPALAGQAEAVIPVADWGLRADAFDAPFEIRGELRSLERQALLRAAEGDLTVLRAAEEDVRDGARAAVVRAFGWGAAASVVLLVVATLIWRGLRPRWALAAIGAGITAVGAGASLLAAQTSFDDRAFESPTYFAQGAELRRILEVAENERVRSEYGSEFASVLRSISTVLADMPPRDTARRDLHLASDLHANALVIDPLAGSVGDAPLLLAGDFGQRGNEAEAALLAPRVAALGDRVIAVSGNHDSGRLMRRLASEGVTVLEDEGRLTESGAIVGSPVIDVEGLTLAGFPDPLERGDEPGTSPTETTFEELPDGEILFERAADDFVRWFDSLPRRPDIVMVHQNDLAQHLARTLSERDGAYRLTIVTGHDHRQHVDRYGDIVVVDGGSVGAGGVFDAGREAIGLAELHFAADNPALRSADLIASEPFSGQAQASRVVIDAMCPEEDRCGFEPPGLETSPPTE
jgi:predicted phosphodiesterase